MSPRLSLARRGSFLAVLLAVVTGLALGGCGRRGAPEPPPGAPASNAAAPAATPNPNTAGQSSTVLATRPGALTQDTTDDELADEDRLTAVSPQPTPGPTNRRRVPYYVPKTPFILDPLL